MKEIHFLKVIVEEQNEPLRKDEIFFIYEVNKEFLKSDIFKKFRGEICINSPFVMDRALQFEEKILKCEYNLLCAKKDLIIENDNEFTLVVEDIEVKRSISSDVLSKLNILSLKDIKSKYNGKQLIVCFDEKREHIELLLESELIFREKELLI